MVNVVYENRRIKAKLNRCRDVNKRIDTGFNSALLFVPGGVADDVKIAKLSKVCHFFIIFALPQDTCQCPCLSLALLLHHLPSFCGGIIQ